MKQINQETKDYIGYGVGAGAGIAGMFLIGSAIGYGAKKVFNHFSEKKRIKELETELEKLRNTELPKEVKKE